MTDKASTEMGWVVQVMSDPPDLDDAPSFAYFHVAIADPKEAVQAVAKQTGTNHRHVRHVMALSPQDVIAFGLNLGEVKPA